MSLQSHDHVERLKHNRRPRKSEAERNRRLKAQKKRLVALGVPQEEADRMTGTARRHPPPRGFFFPSRLRARPGSSPSLLPFRRQPPSRLIAPWIIFVPFPAASRHSRPLRQPSRPVPRFEPRPMLFGP